MLASPWCRSLPLCPLPHPALQPEFYGDVSVKYPLDEQNYPIYFGYAFKARSELRIIMNDIAARCFNSSATMPQLSLQEAYVFYHRLVEWYNALPDLLLPNNIVFPHTLMLQ